MALRLAVGAFALLLAQSIVPANASAVLPLASHRAAYDLSLVDSASPPRASAQTPIAARGLIAYEFRGSPCEGYTSNFRQMTEMERSEGEPLSTQSQRHVVRRRRRQVHALPGRFGRRSGNPSRRRDSDARTRTTTCASS